jgi:hypothetical protein
MMIQEGVEFFGIRQEVVRDSEKRLSRQSISEIKIEPSFRDKNEKSLQSQPRRSVGYADEWMA